MKNNIIFIFLFCVFASTSLANIQPKKGGFSFGLGHTSTKELVKNPNTDEIFTDPISSENLSYKSGLTMTGQYGFSDNLSLFFELTPYDYEDKISGDKASFSFMNLGIRYQWLHDGFIKVMQDFSLISYSLKNEFTALSNKIEKSDRFVGSEIYFMLDFKNIFLLNVVKPYVSTEVYVDAPKSINETVFSKIGIFYNLTERINTLAEYNHTNKNFSFLMRLNF